MKLKRKRLLICGFVGMVRNYSNAETQFSMCLLFLYRLPLFWSGFSRMICIANNIGRQSFSLQSKDQAHLLSSFNDDCVSFWGKGQTGLLPIIKDLGLLSSGSPSCNTAPCCAGAILASLCHLFGGNWDLRDGHQKMLILWLLQLLWVMKSFVSDPRGSCLLPVSIQLWQAKLLA